MLNKKNNKEKIICPICGNRLKYYMWSFTQILSFNTLKYPDVYVFEASLAASNKRKGYTRYRDFYSLGKFNINELKPVADFKATQGIFCNKCGMSNKVRKNNIRMYPENIYKVSRGRLRLK